MAMEPPDVVLSPERPEAAGSRAGSGTTNAALLQLQHQQAQHAQAPPTAFHLAAVGSGAAATAGHKIPAMLLQQQQQQQPLVAVQAAFPNAGTSSSTTTTASKPSAIRSTTVVQSAQLTSIPVPAPFASGGPMLGGSGNSSSGSMVNVAQPTPPIERLSRPMAFDKMESLVREMQDPEAGVPVRSQKLFLTSIPSAFMGYDLIEWLMERVSIEESEALNISNQLCQHGYFFPVSDSKTLMVKDDSSLYRFQTPYYWPWQQKAPDQIEYAIYLAKRSLRNKQRHGLEDYETEALASLHKNLKGKWDFILMQAEEQVRLAKERKKGDKIVGDSQERAYWRVHRPPPGQFTPLEPCPIPSRDRQGKPRKRTVEDWQREVDILKASLGRNRVKMSQACESLAAYYETFSEYDPMMQPPLPSNPWVTEDVSFWQLNSSLVEVPTEKRVKRWGISIEEVVSDPTGLQEFTLYLKKEYSHENIRFWMAVNDLRRSAHSHITRKVKEIYEEFLEPGAPCEINIDGKTMEKVQQGLKNPSRFAFDSAAEHIYMLLLKKDCYPRFVRSEHYKCLMANAIQPSHKKRFFGFGGGAKKKGSTSTAPNPALLTQLSTGQPGTGNVNSLSKRRGSDRSLSGSAHELAISGVKDCTKVPHSHSQSNLSDIPYSVSIYRGDMPSVVYEGASSSCTCELVRGNERVPGSGKKQEVSKAPGTTLEVTLEGAVSGAGTASAVCPWDTVVPDKPAMESSVSVSVCPWDDSDIKPPAKSDNSNSSKVKQLGESAHGVTGEITEVSERMKRSCGLRQNTLDGDFHSTKRLAPVVTEQRRASMTMAPKLSDLQFCLRANSAGGGGVSPPGGEQSAVPTLAKYQQPCLHHLSSVRISQGSLSTSFEEKEAGSVGSVFYQPDAGTTPILSEESLVKGNHGEPAVHVGPDPTGRCPERYRQASEEDWKPTALHSPQEDCFVGDAGDYSETGRAKVGQEPHTSTHKPNTTTEAASSKPSVGIAAATGTSHTAKHIGTTEKTGPVEQGVVVASSPASTTIAIVTTTTATASERPEAKDTEPESAVDTPRINVIYAHSPESGEAMVNESDGTERANKPDSVGSGAVGTEEQSVCGVQSKETSTAASVATQTMDEGACQGDLSPLNEVEDHFFSEALRHQHQSEYDSILDGGDGLLPGCVAPAPTPAPLIAPLAEVELDPPEDPDVEESMQPMAEGPDCPGRTEAALDCEVPPSGTSSGTTATVVIIDDPVKRRKRKERKDRPADLDMIRAQKSEEESSERKGNAVCPWDDEDESAADDAPYVKTYSTLGYL